MSIQLPESAKMYISKKGLPQEEILLIKFLAPAEFYTIEFNSKEYLTVAIEDDINHIGIDEKGCVFLLAEEVAYLSNSFIQFIELMEAYKSLPVLPVNCSENQLLQQADAFGKKIRETDESVLKNPESFWSVILEQVADGLL